MSNAFCFIPTIGLVPMSDMTIGILANRYTADGSHGLYYATDTGILYFDVSASAGWATIGGPGAVSTGLLTVYTDPAYWATLGA